MTGRYPDDKYDWDVLMTTKRSKKNPDNLYTLHIVKDGQIVAKSDEMESYGLNQMYGHEMKKFCLTLKDVDNA